jgi:hypothetical protein
MSEYNQRQYRLMLERLNAFEQGQIRVGKLANDLEGLLNAIQGVPSSWRQTFLHDWGLLEDVRAVMLVEGMTSFDEATRRAISAAVSRLKLLVLGQIDDPADHPHSID